MSTRHGDTLQACSLREPEGIAVVATTRQRHGRRRLACRGVWASVLAVVASVLLSLPITATARGAGTRLTSPGPLAVLVSEPCTGCGPGGAFGYIIALVDRRGQVVARAAARPAPGLRVGAGPGGGMATALPPVSISRSHVYFLDGAAQVRSLAPSGAVVAVTRLPGDATTRVAFAVSPDDRQMAVGLLVYTDCHVMAAGTGLSCAAAHTLAYTAGLRGAEHYDFFASTQRAEWPVAWHGVSVVLGVGDFGGQQPAPNPTGTFEGYHVADPATGLRQATVCGAEGEIALGPLTPAGTVCLRAPRTLEVATWTGAEHSIATLSGPTDAAALSPTGDLLAYTEGATGVLVVRHVGATRVASTSLRGAPLGFVDATHLVVETKVNPPVYRVQDLGSGLSWPLHGMPHQGAWSALSFAGTLPSAL